MIGIGDAVCSFNPIYGQGMTVAAMEAEELDLALTEARHRGGLNRRFSQHWYRRVATIADLAWQGVEIEDYRYPELSNRRTAGLRALQWYMKRLQRATHANPATTEQFYRVHRVPRPAPSAVPATHARPGSQPQAAWLIATNPVSGGAGSRCPLRLPGRRWTTRRGRSSAAVRRRRGCRDAALFMAVRARRSKAGGPSHAARTERKFARNFGAPSGADLVQNSPRPREVGHTPAYQS